MPGLGLFRLYSVMLVSGPVALVWTVCGFCMEHVASLFRVFAVGRFLVMYCGLCSFLSLVLETGV